MKEWIASKWNAFVRWYRVDATSMQKTAVIAAVAIVVLGTVDQVVRFIGG